MNTQSTTLRRRHDQHHSQPTTQSLPVRRVSLPDRIALHLGLALITWSRRTRRPSRPLPGSVLPHEERLERIRHRREMDALHLRTLYPR